MRTSLETLISEGHSTAAITIIQLSDRELSERVKNKMKLESWKKGPGRINKQNDSWPVTVRYSQVSPVMSPSNRPTLQTNTEIHRSAV